MSDLRFVINLVNNNQNELTKENEFIFNKYPHIQKEYLKYIKKNSKLHITTKGTYQFVPEDSYAVYMFKDIDKNSISIDYPETYIVNLFCLHNVGKITRCDFNLLNKMIDNFINKIIQIFPNNNLIKFDIIYSNNNLSTERFLHIKKYLEKAINKTNYKKDGSSYKHLNNEEDFQKCEIAFSSWE